MKKLSRERWEAVDRAFDAVLAAPPGEREGVLETLARNDPELALEVRTLLEFEARGGEELGDSALDFVPGLLEGAVDQAPPEGGVDDLGPLAHVGPYRILREIARGGMGRVYLAERVDPDLPQQVALKLVKRGMDTDDVLLRFRQERRILASLNHPGIARLLDGGATPDGRPWLAMEYVEGDPLGEHLERAAPPRDHRIRLILQLCEAVEYAHRNLVLHRDLKPSNVLVTPGGEAKLLDFGIAKLLHAEPVHSGPTEPVTRLGRRILTPEWASPEQVAGEPLTTASDVYQLGLLLRWALEGGRDPLPRELRVVVGRALEQEPARRYPSAGALGDDLRRFLESRPVLARPPSAAYRIRSFVRRNPAPVAAGTLLLVMGGVFAGLYTRGIQVERDLAQQEADRARAALDFVTALFEGADPTVSGGDTLDVFQLLERGEARLGTHLARRPELRQEMEILLGGLFTRLGEFPRAEALFLSALDRGESEGGSDPLQAGFLSGGGGPDITADRLGAGGGGIALAQEVAHLRFRQGRFQEAESFLAAAQAEAEAGGDPAVLARVLVQRGGNLPYTEDASRAEPLLRRALDILEALPDASPALLAEARGRMGTLLMLDGRYPEGEAFLSAVVESLRTGEGEASLALADALNNLGNLYQRSGRAPEAMAVHEEVLSIRQRRLPAGHPDIALSLNNLGTVAAGAGDFATAAGWMEQAIEAAEVRGGRESRNVALSIMNLGWIRMRQGELERGEEHFRESIGLFRRITGPDSPDTGLAVGNLAQLLQLQGRLAEAEREALEALRIREAAHGPESMHIAWRSWQVADILEDQGRLEEAERYHARSVAVRRIHYPETHPEVTRGRNSLGDLLLRMERWPEAAELFGGAVAAFEADPEADAAELEFARSRLERAEREAAARGITLPSSAAGPPPPPGP